MKKYHSVMIALLCPVITGLSCVDDSHPIASPRNAYDGGEGTLAKRTYEDVRIAFASDRGTSSFNIYIMRGDGSDVTPLTAGNPPEIYCRPDWSPDGRQITFTAELAEHAAIGGQIYVMNQDGSGKRRLATPGGSEMSRWSPDGRSIAFCMWREETYQVYVMGSDGSHLRRLTHDENYAYNPAWAPDGRALLYTSGTDGQIHLVGVDGRHDRVVTHDPRWAEDPGWSPTGEKIAFTSFRDNPADVWENTEIYVINPDGSGCKRLTHNPAIDAKPSWTDDGARIAFVSSRNGNFEIYTMNPNGSDQRRVTDNPALDTDPAWCR